MMIGPVATPAVGRDEVEPAVDVRLEEGVAVGRELEGRVGEREGSGGGSARAGAARSSSR